MSDWIRLSVLCPPLPQSHSAQTLVTFPSTANHQDWRGCIALTLQTPAMFLQIQTALSSACLRDLTRPSRCLLVLIAQVTFLHLTSLVTAFSKPWLIADTPHTNPCFIKEWKNRCCKNIDSNHYIYIGYGTYSQISGGVPAAKLPGHKVLLYDWSWTSSWRGWVLVLVTWLKTLTSQPQC